MRAFIVAMEYCREPVGTEKGTSRVPFCEHAYDLETATLAGHSAGQLPRVRFPACQRGWNSQPEAARCQDCDTIVQRIVRDLITAAVSEIVRRC
jgi:hypothetical protein